MDPQKTLPLGDDSYIIILNTRCSRKVPGSLQALFDYINEGKVSAGDGFIGKIHNEVVALQQDEEVTQIMTMEEEYERRNTSARREGLEQGLEQGRAQGEAAGIKKGRAAATLELARAMKSKGMDTEAISEITGLSGEDIDKL